MPTLSKSNYDLDSLSEYAGFISSLEPISKTRNSTRENGFNWDYGMGWEKAMGIIAKGGAWSEGANNLERVELPEALQRELKEQLTLDTSPAGFMPIVPNVLAGTPDNMLCIDYVEQEAKIIRVNVDMAICATIDSAHLLNRGRAILACIDALQDQGYSVELWACNGCRDDNSNSLRVNVCVKAAGEHYDVGKVAFCLCSVALFRRLFFRAIESHTTMHHETPRGYGWPIGPECEGITLESIKHLSADYETPEKALQTVKQQFIKQLG